MSRNTQTRGNRHLSWDSRLLLRTLTWEGESSFVHCFRARLDSSVVQKAAHLCCRWPASLRIHLHLPSLSTGKCFSVLDVERSPTLGSSSTSCLTGPHVRIVYKRPSQCRQGQRSRGNPFRAEEVRSDDSVKQHLLTSS